ncbi:MAG: hypothetical protein A2070_00475 [Bdellovibrionales bacterium GWC1_52_8]|nr:MAG: hypothetical protein A2Z97_06440 [Bdellovibrionales bacterium GWB1_52_6]OFZ05523.1 MAG: hypothetical protein A2X97_11670 [Bdellovibrionales bacterium GWA1_52_35]OFZ42174.1 MAG: hypothetical protein A2070_00475 [Bdellovibrionales bacterium GWC1_52_8]HCM39108.1 hypothetical protein [Bdellovibrionales bacterium]
MRLRKIGIVAAIAATFIAPDASASSALREALAQYEGKYEVQSCDANGSLLHPGHTPIVISVDEPNAAEAPFILRVDGGEGFVIKDFTESVITDKKRADHTCVKEKYEYRLEAGIFTVSGNKRYFDRVLCLLERKNREEQKDYQLRLEGNAIHESYRQAIGAVVMEGTCKLVRKD